MMSNWTGGDWAAVIAASAAAIVSVGTFAISWRQSTNIRKIEVATNSMKDALVEATAKASFAEGKAEQKANPDG